MIASGKWPGNDWGSESSARIGTPPAKGAGSNASTASGYDECLTADVASKDVLD